MGSLYEFLFSLIHSESGSLKENSITTFWILVTKKCEYFEFSFRESEKKGN